MNAEEEIVGKYCGQEIPAPINVTETAHLQFHSDFSTNLFGFQIEYFVSHSKYDLTCIILRALNY